MLKTLLIALALTPAIAAAAGLEDALNYKPKESIAIESGTPPFTTKDIIDAIPYTLDKRGVFVDGSDARGAVVNLNKWNEFLNDPRLKAFERENFDKCEDFYFDSGRSGWGGGVFKNALIFAFPEDESRKKNASAAIKYGFDGLEKNASFGRNCEGRIGYTKKMKDVINTILEAAPSIKAQSAKMLEGATQQINNEKNEQDAKKARVQEERIAKEKALDESIKERQRKAIECSNSPAYKLYFSSISIIGNISIKENAAAAMQRQQDGAKVSGYIDKKVMADAGLIIADANKRRSELFAEYKRLGGKANKPEEVSAPSDPCK